MKSSQIYRLTQVVLLALQAVVQSFYRAMELFMDLVDSKYLVTHSFILPGKTKSSTKKMTDIPL